MKVSVESISVGDQDKALDFYTRVLGFVKKHDIDMGGGVRWLTLVSPDQPEGAELVLEPNADYPAMKALRESLVKDGIPFTMFEVDDIDKEFKRLQSLGVRFTTSPTTAGDTINAVLDDTCGNLIMIFQHVK
ncbi:MAG: VOC family protein [Hyphomicrobiaceae bacterium]